MEKIYEILAQLRPEHDFKSSTDFIYDGLLDSLDIVSLIAEIEETYDISINGLDIVPENFSSAQAIADLIKNNGGSF